MKPVIVLSLLADSISPTDSYAVAEQKARSVMNKLQDEGQIGAWSLSDDKSGPMVSIIWRAPEVRRFETLRLNLRTINRDEVAIRLVLES